MHLHRNNTWCILKANSVAFFFEILAFLPSFSDKTDEKKQDMRDWERWQHTAAFYIIVGVGGIKYMNTVIQLKSNMSSISPPEDQLHLGHFFKAALNKTFYLQIMFVGKIVELIVQLQRSNLYQSQQACQAMDSSIWWRGVYGAVRAIISI